MRKEILPEMFNYNKYPGPNFVYVADLLKSDAYQFTVLENHKDALDATRFGQRFSEIMLKYDYIVGDWSNDQLRLKGFYEDDRPNTRKTDRISRLSEYLREYCAFGCAYFILKNEKPQLIVLKRRQSLVASVVVLIIVVILLRDLERRSIMLLKRIRDKKFLLSKSGISPNEETGTKKGQALRKSSVDLSSNLSPRMVVVSESLTSRRVRRKLQKIKPPH